MKRWPTNSLASLGPLADGDWILKENYTADGVRLIQVGDIGEGEFIGKSSRFISRERARELQCSFLSAGDILISRMPDPLGRACIFPGLNCPAITAVDVAIFRPDPRKANPRLINYFLNSKPWFDEVLRYATGTTRPRISRTRLEQMEVPVPPLADQERIVKVLDEADGLRKLRAQADSRAANLIPALFHEMFGDPILNPHKWPKSTLGLVCQKLTDGTHFSPPPTDAGVPYITAKHLRKHGLDFDRDPTYISPENHREIYARCDPKPGDVLYIKDGVTTGLAAVNRYDYEFSMLSSLALMRPDPAKCDSEFLCAWLNDNAVKASMLGQMAGAAIRRLTLVKLKNAPILLPPLLLQEDFAKRVTEIRELENKQAASREDLDALFRSMLHRAFRVEL
jgi:type I restriction enzyme S subunit